MTSSDVRTAGSFTGTLDEALRYALSSIRAVTPDLLSRPTPCRDWDLRMLLQHGCQSLAALTEGFATGRIALRAPADLGDATTDLVQAFRYLAGELRTAAQHPSRPDGEPDATVAVGNCPMATGVLAVTGALEVAAHGWDISQASGRRDPLPDALAIELLAIAPLLVSGADRYPLFSQPVSVPRTASASDQLAAFLGRDPAGIG